MRRVAKLGLALALVTIGGGALMLHSESGDKASAATLKKRPAHSLPRASVDRGSSPEHQLLSGTVTSTEILLSRLAPQDRRVVEEFYDQYGTRVFAFGSPQELDWMLRRGYPTPNEILDAAATSTQELRERYQGGDVKAGFFYLGRRSIEERLEDVDPRELQQIDALARELLVSDSPFGGYAYYQYQLNLRRDPQAAIAGLAWADYAGDVRASLEAGEIAASLERRHPGSLPPGSLLFAYKAVQSIVRSQRPALLTRKWEPFPYGGGS